MFVRLATLRLSHLSVPNHPSDGLMSVCPYRARTLTDVLCGLQDIYILVFQTVWHGFETNMHSFDAVINGSLYTKLSRTKTLPRFIKKLNNKYYFLFSFSTMASL